MKAKVFSMVVLFTVLVSVNVHAKTVYLSVAASMTDAFKELIGEFVVEHPDAKLYPNYASSGSLAKQIDQGAPADLYVSANPKWMKYLLEKKMIAVGADRIFAYNKLVFIGGEKVQAHQLSDLVNLDQIAIGTPKSVPAGQYAKQAMENANIYSGLKQAKKLVMAKDVRQALLYADRGEVDGAFVYRTDAVLALHAKILFTVPENFYDRVSYPLGLTVVGEKNDTAKAFYAFLKCDKAIAILKKYGFEPAK